MEVPKSLKTYEDAQAWAEYIMLMGAEDKLDPIKMKALLKTLNTMIRLKMDIPMAYLKMKSKWIEGPSTVAPAMLEDAIKK